MISDRMVEIAARAFYSSGREVAVDIFDEMEGRTNPPMWDVASEEVREWMRSRTRCALEYLEAAGVQFPNVSAG